MPEEFIARSGVHEPPQRLYGAVLSRLEREKNRARTLKLWMSGTATAISLAALVPATGLLVRGFGESGFASYLSLLWSDGEAVMNFWAEYLLSLVDSLPLGGLAGFCLALFVFLGSLKYAVTLIGSPRRSVNLV